LAWLLGVLGAPSAGGQSPKHQKYVSEIINYFQDHAIVSEVRKEKRREKREDRKRNNILIGWKNGIFDELC
jgi:hypothetical protein